NLFKEDTTLTKDEPNTLRKGRITEKIKTVTDILSEDGDRVGSLFAIITPGQTPGSMSFLDIRNNALIVGDAFQTRGGTAVSGQMKFWFPFPAMATWSKVVSLQSAEKTREYEPSYLDAGMGKLIKFPKAVIESVITEAQRHSDRG
ncbi:MBL fold metallo-hydrolase, partial [Bacillus sp. S1-R1J2-FB]|uniref:MBL fold metallo-hydrolase n=1 Tax=Bacillus sp. S1-R1J2-FB TaxID=1973494 RepID=UPI0034CE59B6